MYPMDSYELKAFESDNAKRAIENQIKVLESHLRVEYKLLWEADQDYIDKRLKKLRKTIKNTYRG